jgi:predicted DNA-binding protein
MQNQSVQTLSLRLPVELHARTVAAAKYCNTSLNTLIQEALDRYVAEQEERQLFDAFTELGADAEMSDVSFAFEAQAEVALRD